MLDLESAIKHCEEVAEKQRSKAHVYEDMMVHNQTIKHNSEAEYYEELMNECIECAEEYHQFAEWLRELVHLRNITEYLRDMVTCFEFMDSMHYNEDIIEWAESELRVDMREVNADEEGSENE